MHDDAASRRRPSLALKPAPAAECWCSAARRLAMSWALLLGVGCSIPPESPPSPSRTPAADDGRTASARVERMALRVETGETYDTPPEITSVPVPSYPETAREKNVSGTVWVRVRVMEEGRISGLVTIESGPAELHRSAADAIRSALFLPAMVQGRPVAVWVSIPVEYSLQR